MNILSFDIEEWWVYNNYAHYGKLEDSLPRLDKYLDEILYLLEKKEFKATFFCLGDVAKNFPKVIQKIANKGHHIGCHSQSHNFLGNMTPEEFEIDTRQAIENIENVIGKKVDAYRAPAFSITENTLWALEILTNNGIEYDCSIFPSYHRFGGYPTFESQIPSIINYNGKSIKEMPIALTTFFKKEFAFSGGGYFRLFPYFFIKNAYKKHDYSMSYFHLRDFDAELLQQDSMKMVNMSKMDYFKNFYGISKAYAKFNKLLDDFSFISIEQASKMIDWKNVPNINL